MKFLHLFCLLVLLALCASTTLATENTNYTLASSTFKRYVNELRTPTGMNILRDAPADHLHHHALMYAIRVGGHNFWEESEQNAGKQIVIPNQDSSIGQKTSKETIHWNIPGEKTLLQEVRSISLAQEGGNVTLLDWQSACKAVNDTVLGDVGKGHYHGLGMRFALDMDKEGRFFNDTGKNNGEIVRGDERLTRCKWMAYTAKLAGKPVTVAMFDHPSNPVPMTAFTMGDTGNGPFAYMSATMNLHREPVKLKAEQSFTFQYRIAVWDGETAPEIIEKAYTDYVR